MTKRMKFKGQNDENWICKDPLFNPTCEQYFGETMDLESETKVNNKQFFPNKNACLQQCQRIIPKETQKSIASFLYPSIEPKGYLGRNQGYWRSEEEDKNIAKRIENIKNSRSALSRLSFPQEAQNMGIVTHRFSHLIETTNNLDQIALNISNNDFDLVRKQITILKLWDLIYIIFKMVQGEYFTNVNVRKFVLDLMKEILLNPKLQIYKTYVSKFLTDLTVDGPLKIDENRPYPKWNNNNDEIDEELIKYLDISGTMNQMNYLIRMLEQFFIQYLLFNTNRDDATMSIKNWETKLIRLFSKSKILKDCQYQNTTDRDFIWENIILKNINDGCGRFDIHFLKRIFPCFTTDIARSQKQLIDIKFDEKNISLFKDFPDDSNIPSMNCIMQKLIKLLIKNDNLDDDEVSNILKNINFLRELPNPDYTVFNPGFIREYYLLIKKNYPEIQYCGSQLTYKEICAS